MRKIKIAILDSGFDFYKPLQNTITYSFDFTNDASPIDSYGHGTCITRLIDSIGPNIDICNMKILNKLKKGNLSNLKAALKESLHQQVNIINLSLGIESRIADQELKKIIMECISHNIFIISTSSNSGTFNYLLSEKIISIQSKNSILAEQNSPSIENAFFVENYPRIVPWINDSYILSGANSFLTPFLIKNIYHIIMEKHCLTDVNIISQFSSTDILNFPSSYYQKLREKILDQDIYNYLLTQFSISNLYTKTGELIISNTTTQNITSLVKLIEQVTGKAFIYNSIWLPDLKYLENLSNKLLLIKENFYEQ